MTQEQKQELERTELAMLNFHNQNHNTQISDLFNNGKKLVQKNQDESEGNSIFVIHLTQSNHDLHKERDKPTD